MSRFIWDMGFMVLGAAVALSAKRAWTRSDLPRLKTGLIFLAPFALALVVWALAGFATFVGVASFTASAGPDPTKAAQSGDVDLTRVGQFGDAFGAANSLCGALGVAGVAYALYLQVRQHREEREGEENMAVMAALINGYSALLSTYSQNLVVLAESVKDDPKNPRKIRGAASAKRLCVTTSNKIYDLIVFAEERWGWKAQLAARLAENEAKRRAEQSSPAPRPPEPPAGPQAPDEPVAPGPDVA